MEAETRTKLRFTVETKTLGPWHKGTRLCTEGEVREMVKDLAYLDSITIVAPDSDCDNYLLAPDQFERFLAGCDKLHGCARAH